MEGKGEAEEIKIQLIPFLLFLVVTAWVGIFGVLLVSGAGLPWLVGIIGSACMGGGLVYFAAAAAQAARVETPVSNNDVLVFDSDDNLTLSEGVKQCKIASQVYDTGVLDAEARSLEGKMTLVPGSSISFEMRASNTPFTDSSPEPLWIFVGDTGSAF